MSRGGRGGGRGGRGGARGGGGMGAMMPWDIDGEPDGKPSELFPAYRVPEQRALSASEKSAVNHFLLLRRQHHASPLFTSRRGQQRDPTAPRKIYDQAQRNALYASRTSKASQDPFTAMPTYSQRFVRPDRALPDWSTRPICREMFPDELLDTVDDTGGKTTFLGGEGGRKKRTLQLSRVNALPNAEEAFGLANGAEDEEEREGQPGEEEVEGEEEEEEDEVYDDEDAGDYDAENYFDNGDEMGEDYGDDDGGPEGTF